MHLQEQKKQGEETEDVRVNDYTVVDSQFHWLSAFLFDNLILIHYSSTLSPQRLQTLLLSIKLLNLAQLIRPEAKTSTNSYC